MFLQWLKFSMKSSTDIEYFKQNDRFYDPLRFTVEPNGFATLDELFNARSITFFSLLNSIKNASIFVFTLGLTERWVNVETGLEYASCPGVSCGEFDEKLHLHENLQFPRLLKSMEEVIELLRNLNPKLNIILTVSPVPLIATFQKKHVLIATMEAKSNLRSLAGYCSNNFDFIDYFPSFEMISSFPYRGAFFEPDLRTVSKVGVEYVMKIFFGGAQIDISETISTPINSNEVKCEEELIESFRT